MCAVRGWAAGLGFQLALAADFTIASESACFWEPFTERGFSADSGSTVTLTQRMGWQRAKRFLMLPEAIDAQEAKAAGLVDFVASDGALLMQEAGAMARKLASGAPLALGAIKQLMLRARTQGVEAQMEDEAQTLAAIVRSDDTWEGVRAFVERRQPAFTGR